MIGIVIVSHSKKLAEGVLELASQMTQGAVPMEAVGGIDDPDNPIGTDAMQVLAAIESVAGRADAGVLVLMDLGSALLSAETALDFLSEEVRAKIRLCAAPLVEGTVAAAVQAAAGTSLKEAGDEAAAALQAKIAQLAPLTGEASAPDAPVAQAAAQGETLTLELAIENALGLHARPAANLVTTAGKFASVIEVHKGGETASAKSINQIALLGVRHGDTITITASGPDAKEAVEALRALHADHFGEREADVAQNAPEPVKSAQADGEGQFSGAPASAGYAVGPALTHLADLPEVTRRQVADAKGEIARLDAAITTALDELDVLRRETEKTAGKANAAIFEVHGLILGDRDLREKAVARVTSENVDAAYAWSEVIHAVADDYHRLDDGYMRARGDDVLDCGRRVLRILSGEGARTIRLDTPSIVMAHDLAPSDVAGLDAAMVLGIVTETGGATSHAAILARALGIPAVIGVGDVIGGVADGQVVALDGVAGTVWTAPEPSVRETVAAKRTAWLAAREAAKARGAAPAKTRDGTVIAVLGNIGGPADAARVLEYGAEGVGLFRTEFLFQDREQAPDEDEQYEAYLAAARAMDGRPVIIRTLDVGGDKPLRYLDVPQEANPFLGERGIRFCLARPELLRTQLRALLRAAGSADIRIMYPMVSDAAELASVLRFQEDVRRELADAGRAMPSRVQTGIMVEVPAAAAIAGRLAGLCDFFSIGTNDLTQYVMAADRGNAAVSKLCDSYHPAVLRMIALTCEAGKAAGIETGVCGELAGDRLAAPLLLGLGVTELSMSGPAIPDVKETIRSVDMEACRALAAKALAAQSAQAVRELLHVHA
ncbi:phosphoenolpyruvate-protein phosphotransferase [Solidesulfovibrio fructosivorans JJ]]|uniref:Phosphoenolpyruvate-protein phosphotransferase n=1 Tax=Solidesulfovibrio fructosivorans JJ] TaxID=596151 RepID=E1JU74_SOLFR|nr:phosphoenolpyruvate--protein phosphotransferase [Solidesulfovibrio fructosivorans]EFL52004.1 phosphoenolpyruvate-protein phosphotransferase [Solidesulfovibrio fructosivorans JJ]]